ncbi:hypothetical protein Tco_1139865 [Tanacetum coccineum]
MSSLPIPSPFVIVFVVMLLLLGPGAVPTCTTLSNRNSLRVRLVVQERTKGAFGYAETHKGVLGRDTCEGYIFITARVFLEGTHTMGANQHIIVSTKNMFNVVDILNLKLTVGHHNDTLAKAIVIGSLRFPDSVMLFDVLEYNDNLLPVNKMIEDSKMFVSFDKYKCYIQYLKLGKLVETISEYV